METQTKDLIMLQEIIDLISQYNKQDDTQDYIFLAFRKKENGISPDEVNRVLYVFSCVANCPIHEILGESRVKPLPDHRAMIAFYLRSTNMKLLDIANTIGWNDHSTVLSAIQKHYNLYKYDSSYRKLYESFLIKINENGND